jgi:hypothetical protein
VSYSGDRLHVSSWEGSTAIHGQLVGIEWHEQSGDEYGPGVKVESTDDVVPETDDYSFELTVATMTGSLTLRPSGSPVRRVRASRRAPPGQSGALAHRDHPAPSGPSCVSPLT